MTMAGRGTYQHNIRFPDGLPEKLKAAAEANGRSMNSEIITRLEASFEVSINLAPAFAQLLESHINTEVNARLRAIAAKIGDAT
jgi:hypothetical protein